MRLAKLLRIMRAHEDIGIREQAAKIGVSPSTLSRIERGLPADTAQVVKLMTWLIGRDEQAA